MEDDSSSAVVETDELPEITQVDGTDDYEMCMHRDQKKAAIREKAVMDRCDGSPADNDVDTEISCLADDGNEADGGRRDNIVIESRLGKRLHHERDEEESAVAAADQQVRTFKKPATVGSRSNSTLRINPQEIRYIRQAWTTMDPACFLLPILLMSALPYGYQQKDWGRQLRRCL